MTAQCIQKAANPKTGKIFALVNNGKGTFSVYALCSNYDGHVPGGIRKSWRVTTSRNTDEASARKYLSKRAS